MARPALACSCGQITPVQAIGQAPAIFSGRVIDVQHGQPPTRSEDLTATVAVIDRWKGEVADRVTVYGSTESSSCGYSHFPVGETVTLLAYPMEPHGTWRTGLTTSTCTMGVFYQNRTAMPGLMDEFRAQRERAEAAIRLDVQLRILTGDTAVLGTLPDFHGLTVPELDRPGRDLRRWGFGEAHVSTLKLAGADLRGANLQGLQTSTADLADARLDGAKMAGIHLPWASLPRASLRGVAGPDAAFTKSDLTAAVLDGASLPGADFRGA